jgi:hypothetical protein
VTRILTPFSPRGSARVSRTRPDCSSSSISVPPTQIGGTISGLLSVAARRFAKADSRRSPDSLKRTLFRLSSSDKGRG